MMKIFSLRAQEETIEEVNKLAELERVDKSLVIREALEKGLAQMKAEVATKLFAEGKLTVGEAANIADISIGEMMEKLREIGIDSKIIKEELQETLQAAMKLIK